MKDSRKNAGGYGGGSYTTEGEIGDDDSPELYEDPDPAD